MSTWVLTHEFEYYNLDLTGMSKVWTLKVQYWSTVIMSNPAIPIAHPNGVYCECFWVSCSPYKWTIWYHLCCTFITTPVYIIWLYIIPHKQYWLWGIARPLCHVSIGIFMGSHKAVALVNTLRPKQNGCHFADNTLKCIFLNENM